MKVHLHTITSYNGEASDRSYLYGIKCHEFIKVGLAYDLKKRLDMLQLGTPYKLEIVSKRLVYTAFARRMEKLVHAELAPFAVGREWFRCDVTEMRRASVVALSHIKNLERAYRRYLRGNGHNDGERAVWEVQTNAKYASL